MHRTFATFACCCALLANLAPPPAAQAASPANATQLVVASDTSRVGPTTESAPLALTANSNVMFASREQGRAIMTRTDDYVARMSRFDRMLRVKSTEPVSEHAYLEFVAANVLEWTDPEKARLKALIEKLQAATRSYRLPLPATVLLIKTTGDEEVGQAHTRANAIVLPERNLRANDATLFFLLSHELFHVMSRHDAEFRRHAYALVGFRLGNEVSLPGLIAPLQITNPDAARHDSYIDVTSEGRRITVVPVLLSRSAVYDPQIGSNLDQYWTLRLLVVTQDAPGDDLRVVERNGAPVLLRLSRVQGFFEQVGRNTKYIIHAEEILAENFALLVSGAEVAEPQRLDALRRLLSQR